jgi:hypothetical protein
MSRGDNDNPNDFSHTSEWQNEHAESVTPPDRGSDPSRIPGAYEQAHRFMAQMDESDIREDNADREAGYAGLADATSYARHAKSERTARGGKYDEPVNMPYKPVEGKNRYYPEFSAMGGKHGKSYKGEDIPEETRLSRFLD